MSNKLLRMAALLIVSVLAMYLLYLFSAGVQSRQNGFRRTVRANHPATSKTLDIVYNSYYIAGVTDKSIFLGNVTNPLHLLVVDRGLTSKQSRTLVIRDNLPVQGGQLSVQDSDIYLLDWTHHRFLHGNVSQDGLTSIVTDTAYFSDGIAVNQNSFILKKLFANGTQYVLAKKILQPQELVIDRKLLTCQGEGLFSIDGMMRYAPSSSILCYIYYYRNEYFTIDTNLRQMMHGRTIDTNTIAKIKVSRINSQKVLTLSAPPLVVNRQACVDDGNLYICSNLKADNENGDAFERSSVIDVYNLNTATYRFSFYVRQPNGEKLKTFQVYRDTLYGIQGRSLISLPLRHLTP